MNLKDVVDLLNEDRKRGDDGYIEHNKAMKKVVELTKQAGFGTCEKSTHVITMPNGSKQTIETYKLNKKQCLAVSAALNSRALMVVINRWEELEEQVNKPLSPMMMIAQMAMQLDAQQSINEDVQKRLEHIELNTTNQETHFTTLAYCKLNDIQADKRELNLLGRRASKISREQGTVVNKIKHEKYGSVGSYHENVLELACSQLGLI